MIGAEKMPIYDRTGPEGKGPSTGRGMGDCAKKFLHPGNITGTISLLTAALPLFFGILKDARNPNGIMKKTLQFLKRQAGDTLSRKQISDQ